ncbi:1-phosphofructokinase family hexose kinase [Intestinibacillus massiliensis]|nr:1-phosphofructokinase family hexose kinase [Intestinibacillus massiliensis]
MIYTVTANPSLDYLVSVPQLRLGRMNRAADTRIVPGGKGVNVSIMLGRLDAPNRALGFSGGFSGREIARMLEENGCDAAFIDLPGALSRINLKLEGVEETEINAPGPAVPPEAFAALRAQVSGLQPADVLVLAGAAPNGAPDDFYAQLLHAAPPGVLTVVDADGEQLRQALACSPFLIKPNGAELSGLSGRTLRDERDVLESARLLQKLGARNVLASMGEWGGMLLTEDGRVLRGYPPEGRPVGTVGAGDSMVAGFLAGWMHTGRYEDAFRLGLAAGSATAFNEWLAARAEVERCCAALPPIRCYGV